MKTSSLEHYLSQVPETDREKEVYVYIPFYNRKFKVVALQKLDKSVDEDEPLSIIVSHDSSL